MTKKLENCGFKEEGFWDNLENNSIIKWNPTGKYNKTFDPEYKKFLDHFHNLPEMPQIRVGDILTGKISKISKKEIIVDINYKDSIYVEVKSADSKIVENLQINEDINVMISAIKDNPYEIKGSITELIKMDVANKLKKYYQESIALKAVVKELIPAGFMLNIEMNNINITAFMPNTLAGVNRLTAEQSQAIIGTELNVMLETLQQEKGVYVVSRKKYLESKIPECIEKVRKRRKSDPEYIYQGTVTGTKDFGIFVEFDDCLTGMIHKVNINPTHQDKIHSIKPGTVITFYVRDILKNDKIILTQILRESLWDSIRVGQVKEGTVISVKPFGALISLDEETTGLMQNTYIEKAKIKLEKGDKINVRIVSIIKDDRKIYFDFSKND